MSRKLVIDLTGQKFGALTVVKPLGTNRHQHRLWECACLCGETTTVSTQDLRKRHTTSCGCVARRKRREHAESLKTFGDHQSFTLLMNGYKRGAKVRGLTFSLTQPEFRGLTSSPCHYCGAPPAKQQKVYCNPNAARYTYNGVDRVDSAGHYVISNCVPCCTTCNRIKSNASVEELFAHLEKMIEVHNTRLSSSANRA